jgi:hypothetical protein
MSDDTTQQEPTVEQLNAWFEVLHRLALIQRDDPLKPAFTPAPLRQDIADCVAQGWVRAWEIEGAKRTDQRRLIITPEGREIYDAMCQELANQGRPVTGWIGSADAPS